MGKLCRCAASGTSRQEKFPRTCMRLSPDGNSVAENALPFGDKHGAPAGEVFQMRQRSQMATAQRCDGTMRLSGVCSVRIQCPSRCLPAIEPAPSAVNFNFACQAIPFVFRETDLPALFPQGVRARGIWIVCFFPLAGGARSAGRGDAGIIPTDLAADNSKNAGDRRSGLRQPMAAESGQGQQRRVFLRLRPV